MKYFLDTEFIEGFPPVRVLGIPLPKWMAKRPHTIQLVSIGIVCEDGREYHAVSTEFKPKDADEWVKKNVLDKLPCRYADFYDSPREKEESRMWKSNQQIKYDLFQFFKGNVDDFGNTYFEENPDVYAYYADYDWVVFCSIFGRMIDLPNGFPMYCRDLKQLLDEKVEYYMSTGYGRWMEYGKTASSQDKIINHSFDDCLKRIKSSPTYPTQENEHSALDDAKWNKKLYDFINKL